MLSQPYELTGEDYGLWFEVNERFGKLAGNLLAFELYKPAAERNFNNRMLAVYLQGIRAIAEKRGYALF